MTLSTGIGPIRDITKQILLFIIHSGLLPPLLFQLTCLQPTSTLFLPRSMTPLFVLFSIISRLFFPILGLPSFFLYENLIPLCPDLQRVVYRAYLQYPALWIQQLKQQSINNPGSAIRSYQLYLKDL